MIQNTQSTTHNPNNTIVINDEEDSLAKNVIFKKIKNSLRRVLKKENNIKILNFHIKNGTTPSQLLYSKFPIPFLSYCDNFVQGYNNIFSKTHIEIMNFSICMLNELI